MTTTTKAPLHARLLPLTVFGLSPLLFGAACGGGINGDEGRSSGQFLGESETTTSDGTSSTGPSEDSGDVSSGTDTEDPPESPPTPAEVQLILEKNCAQCHGAGSPAMGAIDYITDLSTLISKGLVIPDEPENSKLYIRISTGTMPPAGVEQRPSEADIRTIHDWIAAGAAPNPPPPNCLDQGFISNDDMFIAMRADTLTISTGDLPFTRYLTLTHLYNSGLCDDQLEIYRHAVTKVVNSLSNEDDAVAPFAIEDPKVKKTMFRIDIRDYGWDANPLLGDVWERVALDNPFAIQFLGDLAEPLSDDLQTTIPNQPADSFLQIATRGQLYYEILEIPGTLLALQQSLELDVQGNINDGEMLRAAIRESGVSQFNRVFDRHSLAGKQYYYESSDFASNAGDANVFVHPIDFVRAGGEIIFSLPNGYQGYAIELGGDIIAEAPTNVVKDLLQPDSVVRAGISCMSCHQAGIIARDDDFFEHYEKNKADFNADRDLIEEIYVPEAMRSKQAADIALFTETLKAANIPMTGPEPIITTSLAYEAPLDLRRAAAELGVTPDRLEDELSGLDSQLNPLRDGTVDRDIFEEVFADTVCLLIPGDNAFPACVDPG